MSFEGHYQLLCTDGHVDGYDVYSDKPERCDCGAEWAEKNLVDETNGCEGNPCICRARSLVEIEPAVTETCNLGHKHEIKEARYKFGPVGCHEPTYGEEV